MKSPRIVLVTLSGLCAFSPLFAQDGPPVDVGQLMQALKGIRETQAAQLKALHLQAIQSVSAAAASGKTAAAAWEEAVRTTQFQGASREGSQFREWREKEGDALGEAEGQAAARLYYNWLLITLQHAAGATTADLLPRVIEHTKAVTQDQAVMEAFEERMKHEREREQNMKGRPGAKEKDKAKEGANVKKMHDQILRGNLAGSVPVQAMRISELLKVKDWEMSPGNVDGIFTQIILPELRASKDARLLDYWDMKLKREGEAVLKSKLAYDQERFQQQRRPELLWSRAQDELVIGFKNKAVANMFALIKAHPTHPQAERWISTLEKVLVPPPANSTAAEIP